MRFARSHAHPTSRSFAVLLSFVLLLAAGLAVPAPGYAQPEEAEDAEDAPLLSARTFSGLELRGIGPALMSGRIADIAVDPTDQSVWYVAVGSGGVWKTENAGTTWTPIFDGQDSYSIGAIAVDPSRPNVVWVGTGENSDGRHVGYGDGLYRSRDGGASWRNVGLEASEHISKIVVHPEDPNRVFVAAKGPLWSGGGDRGLYRTTDGGETWELVLAGENEFTGATDVVMDPRDPDTLYAAMHQRLRTVAALVDGGPGSGIWKSTDGGDTWREVTQGLPGEPMGRIGLAVEPQDPSIVYATVEVTREEGGFYRSTDRGESWEKRNDYFSGGTGPHYYQELFASPHAMGRVYQMDAPLMKTEDGGQTFDEMNEEWKHGDNHAMAFDPNDPEYLLVGSDGGLYESWDLGETWKFVANLPVTQFYKVAVDDDAPFYNVYGGTQDNSTQGGPSRTNNIHGIRNSDWIITVFADGHQPATEPGNPDIVYSEWQQGNLVRYDRTTGEIVYIQPQPAPGDPPERFNWDAPILVSPHQPSRIYYASQRVWRSDDRGDSWRPVSGDLTRNVDRFMEPMMGRVRSVDSAWDLTAMSNFSTITSLAESPVEEGVLWAGTDDGLMQVSSDGGESWTEIEVGSLPGVPDRAFVNDVKADLFDAGTAYVALDNHKQGDYAPYLLKTTDRGASWTSIAGDLPERHLVWRVVQDEEKPGLLFAGTELGLFFTLDGGGKWIELTGGVPTIPFRDLAIQRRETDLVGATFGRGFYVLDDYSPLREVSEQVLERHAVLFPVRDAWWYIPRRPLGGGEKASQGDAFFTAPNPPFGAVFTYHLAEGWTTPAEERREREKELAEAGEDTPRPDWEDLTAEERAETPQVLFTVRDDAGQVLRRITGPASKGFHRVAWDLAYPSSQAVTGPEAEGGFDWFGGGGWMAAPGTYTVSMATVLNGRITPLDLTQSFEVKPYHPDGRALESAASPAERTAFVRRLNELSGVSSAAEAKVEELAHRVGSIRRALGQATVVEPELDATVRELSDRLADLEVKLDGDPIKDRLGEPEVPSISGRLSVADIGNRFSLYGPTPTHLESVRIAEEQLGEVRAELDAVQAELAALEAKLDQAGVPWTPGRDVPPVE
jgi:photosystem II stability/assembly factor-like uncharacterized protein